MSTSRRPCARQFRHVRDSSHIRPSEILMLAAADAADPWLALPESVALMRVPPRRARARHASAWRPASLAPAPRGGARSPRTTRSSPRSTARRSPKPTWRMADGELSTSSSRGCRPSSAAPRPFRRSSRSGCWPPRRSPRASTRIPNSSAAWRSCSSARCTARWSRRKSPPRSPTRRSARATTRRSPTRRRSTRSMPATSW